MDNYQLARDRARETFLQYDREKLSLRAGVTLSGDTLSVPFLGREARISLTNGVVRILRGETEIDAGFSESLSLYDWLCDGKPGATAAGQYCPVHALPGVYVRGSGLNMGGGKLPGEIEQSPQAFSAACIALGGVPFAIGDLGFQMPVFPGVQLLLKFYFGDEDFPPQLTILWDKNMLSFVRYETVYYIAGVLLSRIREEMNAYIRPAGLI